MPDDLAKDDLDNIALADELARLWAMLPPDVDRDAPHEDEQHDLRLSFAHWIAGCCGLALLAALIGMALP